MRKRSFVFLLTLFIAYLYPCAEASGGRKRRAAACGPAQMRQYKAALKHDLTYLKDRHQLKRMVAQGHLIELTSSQSYQVSEDVGEEASVSFRRLYRHTRRYTKHFLDQELGTAHLKFGTQYKITSLVRTMLYQKLLWSVNGNAIRGTRGCRLSSHLTGATVDISYAGIGSDEFRWLRKRFTQLQREGKIVFVIEKRQACFHVMVLPAYGLPPKAVRKRTPRRR